MSHPWRLGRGWRVALGGLLILSGPVRRGLAEPFPQEADAAVEFRTGQGRVSLVPPIEISEIMVYRDGGTIGMQLVDRLGSVLSLCLDGRLRSARDAKKPYKLYLGARHPSDPRGRAVQVGGKEERAVLALLEQARQRTQAGEAHGVLEGQTLQVLERVIDVLRTRAR